MITKRQGSTHRYPVTHPRRPRQSSLRMRRKKSSSLMLQLNQRRLSPSAPQVALITLTGPHRCRLFPRKTPLRDKTRSPASRRQLRRARRACATSSSGSCRMPISSSAWSQSRTRLHSSMRITVATDPTRVSPAPAPTRITCTEVARIARIIPSRRVWACRRIRMETLRTIRASLIRAHFKASAMMDSQTTTRRRRRQLSAPGVIRSTTMTTISSRLRMHIFVKLKLASLQWIGWPLH